MSQIQDPSYVSRERAIMREEMNQEFLSTLTLGDGAGVWDVSVQGEKMFGEERD